MKGLLLALALVASLVRTTASAHAAPCQFVLGFEALHALAPTDIGDCTENQSFASNGDAQQHTTRGLMAWRKADNRTALTNGYTTWLNGTSGLATRLNTERFSWEADFGAPGTTAVPSVSLTVAGAAGGSTTGAISGAGGSVSAGNVTVSAPSGFSGSSTTAPPPSITAGSPAGPDLAALVACRNAAINLSLTGGLEPAGSASLSALLKMCDNPPQKPFPPVSLIMHCYTGSFDTMLGKPASKVNSADLMAMLNHCADNGTPA